MMSMKWLVVILMTTVGLVAYFGYISGKFSALSPTPASPIPEIKEVSENNLTPISFQNETFYFGVAEVNDLSKLRLLPNLNAKLTGENVLVENNCRILVNGGFYGKNNRPLGWMMVDENELNKPISSRLFNGFLGIDGTATISSSLISEARIGLQSGPILLANFSPIKLSLIQDEPARRVVAAIDNEEKFYFLVFKSESDYAGPYLRDLPQLVVAAGNVLGKNFVSAINLDGGSASVFYTPEIKLKELSLVGSFFCLTSD